MRTVVIRDEVYQKLQTFLGNQDVSFISAINHLVDVGMDAGPITTWPEAARKPRGSLLTPEQRKEHAKEKQKVYQAKVKAELAEFRAAKAAKAAAQQPAVEA